MEPLNTAQYKKLRTNTGHTYNYYTSAHPEKTTILFIHGFPYTANIWRWHIALFERLGYGCIAPDLLGMGGSDKPLNPKDYTGKAIAQSLCDILIAEGIEKVVVIGHDWGSIIGSRLAIYFPSNVSALVLVAVPYWEPAFFDLEAVNTHTEKAFGVSVFGYWDVFMNKKPLLEKHTESFFKLFFARDPEMWKKHFMGRGALEDWLINDRECAMGEYVTDIERREFFANNWSAATQYYHCQAENWTWESEKDLPPDRHIIAVPSLMVAATDDACAPLPLVNSSLVGFADVRLAVIEGGHHIHLDHIDKFQQLVTAFLMEKGVGPL
ncbi:hypothetical protein DL768_011694 [Monosporascus sp. mg162]|nr:hypothetical protein DL768_011694 [Monosporascus sp. mg162]